MAEAQSWTATRRGSNPRLLDSNDHLLLDIPATPTDEFRKGTPSPFSALVPTLSPTVTTASAIASWYLSNIGVLLLNKYLLSIYGFRYPIFLTMLHMLSCSIYSYFAIRFLRLVHLQHIVSRKQFFKIFALSVIFCFSVVAGNTSLRRKVLRFTWLWYLLYWGLLLLVIVSLCLICLDSWYVSDPRLGGALKSVVQGIILTSESEKLHSMNLLLYMAPLAAMILFPVSLYFEGNVAGVLVEKARRDWFIVFLLIGNATVAYLVNLTNFLVTKHTSALTLQVLGNGKAAVAAVVSVLIFRNPVSVMGMVGFGVTVSGVVLYSEAKKRTKQTMR
ncbi:unnamed protein product [Rhodiola kirilowii]